MNIDAGDLFTAARVPFYIFVASLWAWLLIKIDRVAVNGARRAMLYLMVATLSWPVMLGLMAIVNLTASWSGREAITIALLVNVFCALEVYHELSLL